MCQEDRARRGREAGLPVSFRRSPTGSAVPTRRPLPRQLRDAWKEGAAFDGGAFISDLNYTSCTNVLTLMSSRIQMRHKHTPRRTEPAFSTGPPWTNKRCHQSYLYFKHLSTVFPSRSIEVVPTQTRKNVQPQQPLFHLDFKLAGVGGGRAECNEVRHREQMENEFGCPEQRNGVDGEM